MIVDRIASLFGSADAEASTVEALESLFREREATLNLTARFDTPLPNLNNEPTAEFPYTLYDADGEVYGSGTKQFQIPDDGFTDDSAPVTQFIGGITDTPVSDVGVGALYDVEGETANARLSDFGDTIVIPPEPPEAEEGDN